MLVYQYYSAEVGSSFISTLLRKYHK